MSTMDEVVQIVTKNMSILGMDIRFGTIEGVGFAIKSLCDRWDENEADKLDVVMVTAYLLKYLANDLESHRARAKVESDVQ